MAKLEKGNLLPSQKAKRLSTATSPSSKPKAGARKIASSSLPHRKRNKNIKANKAASTGNKRFYSKLRLKEKAANERMRQLELAGIKSPAYQRVQAQLEILGKRTKGDRGRRFSETGKATYNEMELLDKILNEFLYENKTSTLTGAREYMDEVWNSANKNLKLAQAGISREEYLAFWENLPSKKDRLYGSEQYVAMMRAYTIKQDQLDKLRNKPRIELTKKEKELVDMDRMSLEEIAAEIEASKDLSSAYKALGLDLKEVNKAKVKINRKKGKKSD